MSSKYLISAKNRSVASHASSGPKVFEIDTVGIRKLCVLVNLAGDQKALVLLSVSSQHPSVSFHNDYVYII